MKDERYFLVAYVSRFIDTGDICHGNQRFESADGNYINLEDAKGSIAYIQGVKNVVITNIIEFNKKDYETFTS